MSYEEILNNQALPDKDADCAPIAQDNMLECCDDPVLFHMRDKHHDFSMGLFTILQCLKVVENKGYVPPLPWEWWNQITNRYHLKL